MRFQFAKIRIIPVLKLFLAMTIAYPALLIFAYMTDEATFPNGVQLRRNVEWGNIFRFGPKHGPLTRGDLYLPNGQLISHRVDFLCWNETAVSGTGVPRDFVWPGGGSKVVYGNDPEYSAALKASGLTAGPEKCGGTLRPAIGAEMILNDFSVLRGRQQGAP